MTNAIIFDRLNSMQKPILTFPSFVSNPNHTSNCIKLFSNDGECSVEGGLRTKGHFKQSNNGIPLISVITIVYNGDKYLEKAIQSIINQTYENLEYIIIDGGSTDGTLDIIKRYEDKVDYWVSEKDQGISDAFNKGKNLSRGKYHIFINADDILQNNNVLFSLLLYFQEDYCIICGGCQLEYKSFAKTISAKNHIYKMPTSHQSIFFNTAFFTGKDYCVSNKLTMDYEFYLKYTCHEKQVYTDVVISKMTMEGVSQQNICKTLLSYIILNYKYNSVASWLKSILYMLKGCTNKLFKSNV